MLELLVAILLITLYIYYKLKIRHFERFASQINGPTGLPIIGNLLLFFRKSNFESLEVLKSLFEQFKDQLLIKFWFGNNLMVSSCDPQVIEVLVSKTSNKSNFLNYYEDLIRGVVFTSGLKWKMERKFLNKMFYPNLYEHYINIFNNKSRIMAENLMEISPDRPYDLSQLTLSCTLDTICCSAMGVDIDAVKRVYNAPLHSALEALEIIINRMHKPWYWIDFIFYMTEEEKRMSKSINEFHNFILLLINKRRKMKLNEKEENNNDKNYINYGVEGNSRYIYLDSKLNDAEKNNISDKQLAYHFDILVAGSDTVSSVTSYTLLMLAMHSEWQEKVHKELDDIYGDSDCDVTIDDINKMEILDMVIKEGMRTCGPVNSLRQIDEDTECGKYTVPAGTLVFIPSYLFHHDSRYWSHPYEFHPEHFLPENVAERPKGSYIPFHSGPRKCPGYKYGLFQVKIMMAHILRKFKLTTELKYKDLKYKVGIMFVLDGGSYVHLHKRK